MASSTTPLVGRSKLLPKSNGRTPSYVVKTKGKPNGSILNFFKKAGSNSLLIGKNDESEDTLFLEESPTRREVEVSTQILTPPRDYDPPESPSKRFSQTATDQESLRFNEESGSVKRRRVERSPVRSSSSLRVKTEAGPHKGPFIEDSDSAEEAVNQVTKSLPAGDGDQGDPPYITPNSEMDSEEQTWPAKPEKSPPILSLQRKNTSIVEKDEFEGFEDFIDDEFPEEGEEFLERRWMEEQEELEPGLEKDDGLEHDVEGNGDSTEDSKGHVEKPEAASCPICSGSFAGLTDQV